jgi:N-acetylglucosamine kinase
MIGGIDLGGTKIEARLFDAALTEVARHRIPTPTGSYDAMLDGILSQVRWLEAQGDVDAIGLGTPGLINPETGVMLTANLPASGHPLGHDISALAGREIAIINDCRAFTLSEARMGAGQGYANVVGLIIGTGTAGGQAHNGQILTDLNGQHGEYGHLPLPAEVVARHDLPLMKCGCGLTGCFETYLRGPGLVELAMLKTGQSTTTQDIMQNDHFADVRAIWIDIAASLIALLTRAVDPQVIVLGGGLGTLPWLPEQLVKALDGKRLARTNPPVITHAHHGDASGALGAALYAHDMGAQS